MAVAVALHDNTASTETKMAGKEEARENKLSSSLLLPSDFLPVLPTGQTNLKPEGKIALDVFCRGLLPETHSRGEKGRG